MNEIIEETILALSDFVKKKIDSKEINTDEALKYTQSALNLANAGAVLSHNKIHNKNN